MKSTQVSIRLVCTLALLCEVWLCAQASPLACGIDITQLPRAYQQSISTIHIDQLAGVEARSEIQIINNNLLKVNLVFDLPEPTVQDDWQIRIKPSFEPTFNWAPHLTPTDSHVIDQHVFRSPSLIVTNKDRGIVIIPDIDILSKGSPVRWYMDMNALKNELILGMSNTHVPEHVLYERTPGAKYPKGRVEYGFYIMLYTDKKDIENPFRKPLAFFWNRWGHPLYKPSAISAKSLEPYVEHTYNWAFNTWQDAVWQEFRIGETTVGAPTFIVNTTQSPNYPGEVNEREFRSIWNQAWFSSLRSASGLYRYARRISDKKLAEKANLTKELALAAPFKDGFFYGLIGTEMHEVEIAGKKYNRSKGWDTMFWGNSNRNPYTWDAKQSPFHLLDMSWTALLMLRWYDELEKDERLLAYATKYADALLLKQYSGGFFPGWLDLDTLQPMEYLNNSPETSMSVTFLLKLFEITKNKKYEKAALKAMSAVIDHVIYSGRWEDFETYWSCCRYGTPALVGKKVSRNNMYKQCNFSMFWTAEALYECYKLTEKKKYLNIGQRVIDELLMTQASWQPPYIYVDGLGGFGVMNSDGEWNDSRGSLFAETILNYGRLCNLPEYKERALSALKTSFVMMYCPENPKTRIQWEKVWPFFNEKDFGFTMENYGHGGWTTPEGEGMGEFTIYDWGNGAASEAYNRILDKFGKEIF